MTARPLDATEVLAGAAVLARAFADDPAFVYLYLRRHKLVFGPVSAPEGAGSAV